MTVKFIKDDYAGKKGRVRSDLKKDEERVLVLMGKAEYVTDAPVAAAPTEQSAPTAPTTEDGYNRRDMQAARTPKPKRDRRTKAAPAP